MRYAICALITALSLAGAAGCEESNTRYWVERADNKNDCPSLLEKEIAPGSRTKLYFFSSFEESGLRYCRYRYSRK